MTALVQECGQHAYYKLRQPAEQRGQQPHEEKQRVYLYFHEFQTGISPESV